MIVTGKELQRLSYKLCQELGEEENLELLNRVALFLYYEHRALGFKVETDRWRVSKGIPVLFDQLPKYSCRRKGKLNDWYWFLIQDKYDYLLSCVKNFYLINNFYPTDKLNEITSSVSDRGFLKEKELLQISFYALHI